MTEGAIRSMVEQHSCEVLATRYSLRLEWAAAEPCSHPESTRYLLRVELSAVEETTKAPMQMHIAVWLTRLSEFPVVLDDALRVHLFERAIAAAPKNPWPARMQRWAGALRNVSRYPALERRH